MSPYAWHSIVIAIVVGAPLINVVFFWKPGELWGSDLSEGRGMTGDDPKPTAASITAAAANQFLEERDRARHLAKHLFQMIPPEVWREQGGDDGQGHYEGDYWAADIEEEIRGWGDDPGRTELRS